MKVFVSTDPQAYPGSHPAVSLFPDSWDDYGFKTTYHVKLWTDERTFVDLQTVKIMRSQMKSGRADLAPAYDDGLPDEYASLGTDIDYYSKVSELQVLGRQVLSALRDVAVDPDRYERFRYEHAFEASLTRLSPAQDALKRMRRTYQQPIRPGENPEAQKSAETLGITQENDRLDSILNQLRTDIETEPRLDGGPLILEFTPAQSASKRLEPPTIIFDFDGPAELPRSLIAVIGPNGTGKTTLLADLAFALFFGMSPNQETNDQAGKATISSGSVRDLIFISYSAYDNFEIPQDQVLVEDAKTELERQGYIFVGLRKLDIPDDLVAPQDKRRTLKSISEIDKEFVDVVGRLTSTGGSATDNRRAIFASAVKELFEDPSFAQMATLAGDGSVDQVLARTTTLFPTFSTGHKAIMNIVAALCLHLKMNSLVLMDEPEAHLHPPMIASLLKITRTLLAKFRAHAIVATHSPVVIQETLGRHVLVLNRIDNRTNWSVSLRETFGENLATLTRETLGLPAAKADYIGQLDVLIDSNTTLADIEKLFDDRGMSSPARAQAIRLISARQMGQRS